MNKKMWLWGILSVGFISLLIWTHIELHHITNGPAFSNDIFNHWVYRPLGSSPDKMVWKPKDIALSEQWEYDNSVFYQIEIKRVANREFVLHRPGDYQTSEQIGEWRVADKNHLEIILGDDIWMVEILEVDEQHLVIGRFWIPSIDEIK